MVIYIWGKAIRDISQMKQDLLLQKKFSSSNKNQSIHIALD